MRNKGCEKAKKSWARIAKGSRLFRARGPSPVCRGQLSLVKFRRRNETTFAIRRSGAIECRSPAPRSPRRHRRHRGRFRRQKEDPLTASLSLFNIPVISASRRATRECCLCTHPGSLRVRRVEPEIVPTRFCDGEYAAGRESRFEVFPPREYTRVAGIRVLLRELIEDTETVPCRMS